MEHIALVYDASLQDGHLGRKFPLLWRRYTGAYKQVRACYMQLYGILKDHPKVDHLEVVEGVHGSARGPDWSEHTKIKNIPEMMKGWEHFQPTPDVTAMKWLPQHDKQWLILPYQIKPRYSEYGAWHGRRHPMYFWEMCKDEAALKVAMVNSVGNHINRREGMKGGMDNLVFVTVQNGEKEAKNAKEWSFREALDFAFENRHLEGVDNMHKSFVEQWKTMLSRSGTL